MTPTIGIVEAYRFRNYKNAVEKHGGEVKELLVDDEQIVDEYIDQIHGLLLPGGADINIDKSKDEFEISLFNEAMEKDMPVFGICRGIQIMNVERGGSLYEDIPTQITDPLTHREITSGDFWHPIKVEPDSQLNKITCESITEVTSSHHQAVNRIGEGFEVTAKSKDGIIEAIEDPSKEFVIGVQYHPERMWIDENQPELGLRKHAKRLFKTFINAAKTYSANHK